MLQAAQNYQILIVALVVIGASLALMVVSIAVGRVIREKRDAAIELRMSRLRPQMLNLVAEGDLDHEELDALVADDGELAESIAWQLLPKVRGSVRSSLVSWLFNRGAIEREVETLNKGGVVARSRAAERIGRTGMDDWFDELAVMMKDPKREVCVVAARALGKMGSPAAVPILLDSLDGKKSLPVSLVAMAIMHIGPGVVDGLIDGLHRSSVKSRLVCAELLGLNGDPRATRVLSYALLNDDEHAVRERCAKALGRLGTPGGAESLLRATSPTADMRVRIAAVRALGQIGGRDAIATIHSCALSEVPALSIAAMTSLSELGSQGRLVLNLLASGRDIQALRARGWLARCDLAEERAKRRLNNRRVARAHRRVGEAR